MISRCPSCGSLVKEEERVCPSCGWDFVARKRVPKPGAPPAVTPAPEPPKVSEPPKAAVPPEPDAAPKASPPASFPAGGGLALPPARNLNEPPPQVHGLKPLPRLEPRAPHVPGADENPFTLRAPEAPKASPPPAPKKEAAPPRKELPPAEPEMKTGFSLPSAKSLEPAKIEPPPRKAVPEPIRPKPPARPPVRPPQDDGEGILDLDVEPEADEPQAPPEPEPAPKDIPEQAPAPGPLAPLPADLYSTPEPEPALEPSTPDDPVTAEDVPGREPKKPSASKQVSENATPAPQPARNSPVYIAAVAGAALGTVSVLAVYLLLRPDTTTGSHFGESPFVRNPPPAAFAPAAVPPKAAVPPPSSPAPLIEAPEPAPAAPAALPAEARPAASFANSPRVVVAGDDEAPPSKTSSSAANSAQGDDAPEAPAPKKPRRAPEPVRRAAKAKAPQGPSWNFEGVVFDLLTARGVFAAKLVYLDADGNDVGQTETGPGGRYRIALPVSASGGYTLRISHSDYTTRYIDEGDATSSLREATPEERQILMQAAARNLPWVGNTKKTLHRDLALVPKSPEEP
ncbi:MAG: hypothetical protein KGL74_07005 [Elusimicrobia bacterium]|nr:hypothetical protein [Elusimicrobiota bacterium]